MKNKLLFCLLLIASSTFAIAPNTYQVGPWSMNCISTQAAQDNSAFEAIKDKTFQMCAAKQIVQQKINDQDVTATFVISPVFTSFSVKNIQIKGINAYLIIGDNDPIPLNSFCHAEQNTHECFFMLQDKNININHVMSLLDQAQSCELQFTDAKTQKPTNIVFSLDKFDQVHTSIQNAEENMKNAFQQTQDESDQ